MEQVDPGFALSPDTAEELRAYLAGTAVDAAVKRTCAGAVKPAAYRARHRPPSPRCPTPTSR
ncbi:hypothetical protein ACFV2Q_08415 [Streptomyces sp. NPDC059650]|uniref:hypothetical protein n=1 Tax=Streptomyces sp. NPDC059650 TaxID=3346896 RepID=UPI0036BB8A37